MKQHKLMSWFGVALAALLVAVSLMPVLAVAQNTLNYSEQGGASWKVGGTLTVLDGGVLNLDDGAALTYDTGRVSRLLHSNTAAGAAFLGTQETEAVLGSGTYSVDPDLELAAGDVLSFEALVVVGLGVSDDELQLRVRVGGLAGTVITDTSSLDIVTDDAFFIRGTIPLRTVGASGTAYATTNLIATLDASNVSAAFGTALSSLDTTAAIPLVVTGVWDASAADTNSATLQSFMVWLN